MSFILGFITNSATLIAVVYHTYAHYRLKKEREQKDKIMLHSNFVKNERIPQYKNYPYVFILLSIILAFERSFAWFIFFIPFYNIVKLGLISMICIPGTNMANRLYKEYVYQLFEKYQALLDNILINIYNNVGDYGSHIHQSAFRMFKSTNSDKAIELVEIDQTLREPVVSEGKD